MNEYRWKMHEEKERREFRKQYKLRFCYSNGTEWASDISTYYTEQKNPEIFRSFTKNIEWKVQLSESNG